MQSCQPVPSTLPLLWNPLPPLHPHTRIWVSLYLPAKMNFSEESALTLVRHENRNHISHLTLRHCGSGKQQRREGEKRKKKQNRDSWLGVGIQFLTK